MNKKSFKRIVYIFLAVALIAFLILAGAYIEDCHKYGTSFSLFGLISYLGVGLMCFLFVALLLAFLLAILQLTDNKSIKSALRLIAKQITIKSKMKVVNSVYPSLLYFLYDVLQSNNEFLKLPLGKDCSSLLKEGYNPLCVDNCIFYTFQIIMPKKSYDFDDDTLKQIVQSYIEAQLLNYGMVNLPSYYNSKSYGMIPSVYIEKVVYNEEQHLLKFAVMYISCEDDVRHYIKSKKRDEQLNITTDKVYDDEV
jgi:uncharacterized membrane protein